jgi:hypothetical protein
VPNDFDSVQYVGQSKIAVNPSCLQELIKEYLTWLKRTHLHIKKIKNT